MILKGLIDEDIVNYKYPSMTLLFPNCSFKCEIGETICQNSSLALEKNIQINPDSLCQRYLNNPITRAIVCQGLEPMDSFNELVNFIKTFREDYDCNDDIVIYTGYDKNEITEYISELGKFKNIIIKFGRYISGHKKHFDKTLGVYLASDNQYAINIGER